MATLLDTCEENSKAAKSLYIQGKHDEALKKYQEVLKIQKVKLGDYHHDTLVTQRNIGGVLLLRGETDGAFQICNKVYEVQKRSNPEHPDTLVTREIISSILIEKREYKEALKILREVLEISERNNNRDVLGLRQNIAMVLHKLGRYQEALDGYNEIYAIYQKRFGKDHSSTLSAQNNIANIFFDLRKYDKAEQIFEEIYEGEKKTLGLKHPSTLTTQVNLAKVLVEQVRPDEALIILENVYRYRAEVLGPDNSDTINTLAEIANILWKTGKYENALLIYKDLKNRSNRSFLVGLGDITMNLYKNGKLHEALSLYTEVCENMANDVDRLDYLTMQYNIANILRELIRYDESLNIFKQVYKERNDILGSDHERTLDAWASIALLLMEVGKYSEALESLQKVKEKRINILGPGHQSVLYIKKSIAELLFIMGNHKEALNIAKEIYEIAIENSSEHPETLALEVIFFSIFGQSGKYTEALEMLYKTLEKQKNVGSPVLHTLNTRSTIAFFIKKKENYHKALKIFEEVYEKKKCLLGSEHPDTLKDQNSIGSILISLGQIEKALEILNDVHEKLQQIFGKEHLDTLTAQYNIATALSNLGRHAEAIDMYKEVLDIKQKILPKSSYLLEMKLKIAKELRAVNKCDEALNILTEIFETQKAHPLHPDTLSTQNCIAEVLIDQRNFSKALGILKDVIEKRTEVLGFEHIETLISRGNLAVLLLLQNEFNEALKISDDIYGILKRTYIDDKCDEKLGDTPSNYLLSKNNIAIVYSKLGKFDKALEIYKEVYEKTKKFFGAENSDCLTIQHSMASVLVYQEKYSEALPYFYDVYRKRAKSLGKSQPLTLQSLKSIEDTELMMTESTLFVEVRKNDVNQVKNLIARGYDINVKDIFGMSPLHMAAECGNVNIMKLLLEHGASYNIRNEDGHKPLFFAADEECKKLISSIERTFDAVKSKNIDVIKKSVKNEFIINAKDDAGSTVLHWACNRNEEDIVNFLLIEGADPTLVTNRGNTALHIACLKRNLNIADALIRHVKKNYPEKMADFVNRKTTGKGTTSLHIAAKNGDFEIIKILIDNEVDLKTENCDGKKPLDLAPKSILDLLHASPETSEL